MNALDEAIYGEGFKNSAGKSYTDYLDTESFAKYWWMQVFFKNDDGYGSDSTFLYKPRNDKLYYGPVWDFDLAISAKIGDLNEETLSGISDPSFAWTNRLMTDPGYASLGIDDKLWESARAAGSPFLCFYVRYYDYVVLRWENAKI